HGRSGASAGTTFLSAGYKRTAICDVVDQPLQGQDSWCRVRWSPLRGEPRRADIRIQPLIERFSSAPGFRDSALCPAGRQPVRSTEVAPGGQALVLKEPNTGMVAR